MRPVVQRCDMSDNGSDPGRRRGAAAAPRTWAPKRGSVAHRVTSVVVGAVLAVVLPGAVPAVAAGHLSATRLVAHAAPATLHAGSVLVVSGSVSPRSASPLLVQSQVGGVWHTVGKAKLAARGGGFSLSVRAPKSPGGWVLRVARARSDAATAGVSGVLRVRVVTTMYVVHAAAAGRVMVGAPVVVTGSVKPKATGSVSLQRLVGKTWVAFGSSTLSASSSFRLALLRPIGSYRLRVVKAFSAKVAAGVSKPFSVAVVAAPVTVTPPPAPLVVTTASLPAGRVGVAYTATLTATGGVPPYSWSAAGSPPGLLLATTGVLSGRPKTPGAYPVTVTVIDGAGRTGTADLTVGVARPAGRLWSWGSNAHGQLGNGTVTDSSVLVPVSGLTSVTAVTAGAEDGDALGSDGTVWAWGDNSLGQLGDATITDSNVPVQVSGLSGVTAISSGGQAVYALRADGTVWAWGGNQDGELGNGSTTDSDIPVQVRGLTSVTAIAAAGASGYALRADGTVWAWGYNHRGQLGNNSVASSDVPVQVSGLIGVTALAGGVQDAYALRSDGTVWDWGYNNVGELGNSSTNDSSIPVQVSGLTAVTAISAGYAVRSDGSVWAWGANDRGQLGNGSSTYSTVPVQVSGLSAATEVAAGYASAYALRSDGYVSAWGSNAQGQLGTGSVTDSGVPVQTSGLTGVVDIGASPSSESGYAIETG